MTKARTLKTERLYLRPINEEDAELVFRLFNSPKWLEYIGDRNIKSTRDAEDYIRHKMVAQLEKLGFSSYTMIRKSDSIKLGICGLYDREGIEGIDIGFALLPGYEKMGYAFEAASKILDAAFNAFGLAGISAITVRENIASQKLLEKLGLKLSGTIKLPGEEKELLLYKTEARDPEE